MIRKENNLYIYIIRFFVGFMINNQLEVNKYSQSLFIFWITIIYCKKVAPVSTRKKLCHFSLVLVQWSPSLKWWVYCVYICEIHLCSNHHFKIGIGEMNGEKFCKFLFTFWYRLHKKKSTYSGLIWYWKCKILVD